MLDLISPIVRGTREAVQKEDVCSCDGGRFQMQVAVGESTSRGMLRVSGIHIQLCSLGLWGMRIGAIR